MGKHMDQSINPRIQDGKTHGLINKSNNPRWETHGLINKSENPR